MGNIIGIAIVWLIIEILICYAIAQHISGWWIFGWIILAIFIGLQLIKKGSGILKPMATQMQSMGMGMLNPSMRPSENGIIKAVAASFAGLLLVIPGIFSDVLAMVILLPPVQNKIKDFAKDYATKNQEKLMQMAMSRMGGQNPFGGMGGQNPFGNFANFGKMGGFGENNHQKGTVVDGQAKTIETKKSANDD